MHWNFPTCGGSFREGGNIGTPTTPETMRQQIVDEIANWRHLIIEVNNIKVD